MASSARALPIAGTTFTMRLTYGTGSNLAVLAVGVSDQQWLALPLPLSLAPVGMPGCTLYVSTEWLSFAPLTNGTSNVAWPLPSSPAALGFQFFSQALVFEPGANPFGAIVSAGAAGVVGAL